MQNPFDNPGFSMASLTAAINLIPNRYGRLEQLDLFPAKPVRTRQVVIEERNGTLNLLPTLPLGGPSTVECARQAQIALLRHPAHAAGRRRAARRSAGGACLRFGNRDRSRSPASWRSIWRRMRNKHAITLEHLRMGALKGVILDADGSVLHNLYTDFGIAPKSVNFALATETTNVRNKCVEVMRPHRGRTCAANS